MPKRKRVEVVVEESISVEPQSKVVVPAPVDVDPVTASTSSSSEIKQEGMAWRPKNWEAQLKNIKQMRANFDAPVDSMGPRSCVDKTASDSVQRFQILLSLMLSSQTKDQVTSAAMQRLIQAECATVADILSKGETKVGELIYPVGFWKKKAVFIVRTAQILKDQYESDVPQTFDKLCELPGVGPKMAHLVMELAWHTVTGVAVDTHVHRIVNRLKWAKSETKTPEQTRNALEAWLARDLWSETNHLLVGFGQTICKPINPNCGECLNVDICPFAKKNYRQP